MPTFTTLSDLVSDVMFATVMSLVPIGIFVRDNEGNYVYVNAAWEEITGLESRRALGLGWLQALHPEDRSQVVEARQQAVANGTVFQAQYRFVQPDGRIVTVMGRMAPLQVHTETIGYFGCIVDVTGLILQHRAMSKSADQLTKAIQSTGVTVSAQNRDLEYLWMDNPHWMFDGKRVQGSRARDLLPRETADQLDNLKRQVIATGKPSRSIISTEFEGKKLGFEFYVKPTTGENGEIDGVLTTAIEVTEILQAKEQLEATRDSLIKVMDQALNYDGGYRHVL